MGCQPIFLACLKARMSDRLMNCHVARGNFAALTKKIKIKTPQMPAV